MSRTSRRYVEAALVALVGGAAVALGGPEPLGGSSSVNAVFVATVGALVVMLGAWAPRAVTMWTALLAGAVSGTVAGAVVGLLAFVGGMAAREFETRHRSRTGVQRPGPDQPDVINAALAAVALNLCARSIVDPFLGASATLGVVLAMVIVVAGLRKCGTRLRRSILAAAGLFVFIAVASSIWLALASVNARDSLSEGETLLRQGLRTLGDGDFEASRDTLEEAQSHFADARSSLATPLGVGATVVPIAAQHRTAALTLTEQVAAGTQLAVELLDAIESDELGLSNGGINLEQFGTIERTLQQVQVELEGLDDSIERVNSQWLLPAASERLDSLENEIADQRSRSTDAISTLAQLPALLGADEQRVYLVIFTTPSEARGLGGFTGNWAEITVDQGRVELTDFGRADELDDAAAAGERIVSGPSDWLRQYGQFGFNTAPGGTVDADPFKNVTMSPLMSSTGAVVAELYEQSGGQAVDGVIVADVYVLAEFLRFTGPIDVPGLDEPLDRRNAPRFLLHEQYRLREKDERIDLIEDASRLVVDQLLTSTQVSPARLLGSLGPLAESGRLAGWAARTSEQALFEDIGFAGTLLPSAADDAVTMAFNNAAGNKIDYYLDAEAELRSDITTQPGEVSGTFALTLKNRAPASGQPPYVIANAIDEPEGTNFTWVSIFSRFPPDELLLDGEPIGSTAGVEAGYFVTSVAVMLAPGQSRTLELRYHGEFDDTDGYSLMFRSPPTVGDTPFEVELAIDDGSGRRVVSDSLDEAGVRLFDVRLDI